VFGHWVYIRAGVVEMRQHNRIVSILGGRRVRAPSGLTYSTNPASYSEDSAIASNSPTVTGVVSNYSVSPALPTGLSLNASTGVITGTPTTPTASAVYTITASNSGGSTTVDLTIVITDVFTWDNLNATATTDASNGLISTAAAPRVTSDSTDANDCVLSVVVADQSFDVELGLTQASSVTLAGSGFSDADYSIYLSQNSNIKAITESGTLRGGGGAVAASCIIGDVFEIRRVSDAVSYWRNGVKFYDSGVSASGKTLRPCCLSHGVGNMLTSATLT
jgi:hypothetical protein